MFAAYVIKKRVHNAFIRSYFKSGQNTFFLEWAA